MTPYAQLSKTANAASLVGRGIKSLWNNGVWKSVGNLAAKGVGRTDRLGSIARGVAPVANAMTGRIGTGVGLYGMVGMLSPLTGVNLPGSNLALNLGMPGASALFNGASLATTARAGSDKNKAALKGDVERGSQQAMKDYLSGLHIMPGIAADADSYRDFSTRIGRDMKGADTYTKGGYKDMGRWQKLQAMFENPQELIQNQTRLQIQDQLPGIMNKKARLGSILKGTFNHGMKALTLGSGALALGAAVSSKKPYDETAAHDEGYAAAQAAIQKRLQGLTGIERSMAKWDPSFAAMAVGRENPGVLKEWEVANGKINPGMLASTVEAFRTGGTPKFFSTDAGGNRNYVEPIA